MTQEVMSFVLVLVCAMGVAGMIGALYATGLRLWIKGEQADEMYAYADAGAVERRSRHSRAFVFARVGSAVCFALCVAIVLFALWLIVPAFH